MRCLLLERGFETVHAEVAFSYRAVLDPNRRDSDADTWQKSTMPNLFPAQTCAPSNPAWVCWGNFRKTHSLKDLQTRWTEFWKANHEKIYWDNKARCFRLRDAAR